jgi:hypothetical protein
MKDIGTKLLKFAAVIGGGMFVMRLLGPRLGERLDRMFEDASDDFPPKWMFVNITAIRENTERILDALVDDPTKIEAGAG